jgi:ribosomal protein S6--L-glutamate ligase
MHFAVLALPDSWYFRDLHRAAGSDHRVSPLTFSQMRSRLVDGRQEIFSEDCDLNEVDAVLVRTMPPGSLERVVFRMDLLARLEAAGRVVINPPKAIEAAVDKYLTLAKLQSAGLPIPETIVCQTADDAIQAFVQLDRDVVVKPLFGGEGRGIARLQSENLAFGAFRLMERMESVIYLQRFVPHEGYDIRVLLIGEKVFTIRRRNPHDWRTNVSRGARAEPFDIDDETLEIARRAAKSIGAPMAGVDLLPGRDGKLYVLEVNAVPGWKALSKALDIDIARITLEFVESLVESNPAR